MIILGIDPGFARTGYGLIKKEKNQLIPLDFGCISTEPTEAFCDRLVQTNHDLKKLIKKYQPDQFAIEELFFFKNTKTALAVASARGALLLTARQQKLPVFEYTPLQIKQAVTGYGRAEKTQVMQMIKNILKINKKIKLDDTSDALATAVCHAHFLKHS